MMDNKPMSFQDVKTGLALVDIGCAVSLRLVADRRCFIKVSSEGNVTLTPTSDVVDLQIISEDKAIQVCCILGYSDEEMLSLIRRRSELTAVGSTVGVEKDELSS